MFKYLNEYKLKNYKITITHFLHDSGLNLLLAKPNGFTDAYYFNIGFRTFPVPKSGLAHITEHLVLANSKKYNTEDLFFRINKEAPFIMLNAVTYQNATFYYFATPTLTLFKKATDIYLDAVFRPTLTDADIFREGVYRKTNKITNETPLGKAVSGVVFNEMLGSYSQPAIKFAELLKTLYKFPGSDSGGYPPDIVKVNPEDVREFHKTFYSPENAVLSVYGNFKNTERLLNFLEKILKEKIAGGKFNSPPPVPKVQPRIQPAIKEIKFNAPTPHVLPEIILAIPFKTPSKDQDFIQLAKTVNILSYLFDPHCGPLHKLIKKEPLLQHLITEFIDSYPFLFFAIEVTEIPKGKELKALEILKQAIQTGLEKVDLTLLNKYNKFRLIKKQVFSTSPKFYRIAESLLLAFLYAHNNLEGILKPIDGLYTITPTDLAIAQKSILQSIAIIGKPDTNYAKELRIKIIKKLKKLPAHSKVNTISKVTTKTIIRPSKRLVKTHPPKYEFCKIKNIYHIKSKEGKLTFFTAAKSLTPTNDASYLIYKPIFNRFFANSLVYPAKYRKIKCHNFSQYSAHFKEKFSYNKDFSPVLYLKTQFIAIKNRETDGINRLEKTINWFNPSFINYKVATSLIDKYKQAIATSSQESIAEMATNYILTDINEKTNVSYHSNYLIYHNILANVYKRHKILPPPQHIDIDSKALISNMFKLYEYLRNPNEGIAIVGSRIINQKLLKNLNKFTQLSGTNIAIDQFLTYMQKTHNWSKMFPTANKKHLKEFILDTGQNSAMLVLVGINKTTNTRFSIKQSALTRLATSYLTEHMALPLARSKYNAYGGYIKIAYEKRPYWTFLFYRVASKIAYNYEKLIKEVQDFVLNIKINKTTFEQIRLKEISKFTAPDSHLTYYADNVNLILNQHLSDNYIKNCVSALYKINNSELEEYISNIFTDFTPRVVLIS